MKDKLWKKDFTLVVIGQIISIMGSAVLRFALDLYILDITGRADIFALVIAISSVPGILFSPIGGAIADRFNRRNLMVIFDFMSSFVVLCLMILLFNGKGQVVAVGIIMSMLALISSIYQPAVQASIPVLTSEKNLTQANGIVNGVGALSGLMGPIIGSVLYGFLGINVLVVISCVMFFASAVMEIFIKIPFKRPEQKSALVAGIWKDMKKGIQYMVRDNVYILKTIIIAALLNMLVSPFFIIGVPYILRFTMKSSDLMYGAGMSVIQIAGIVGALLVGVLTRKTTMDTLYRWLVGAAVLLLPMALAVTPQILALGYWPSFALFFFFGGIIIMLLSVVSIFVITEVQRETPNEMLGKVMAICMALSQCVAPVGQIIYGGLFEACSKVPYVPILCAMVFALVMALVGKKMLKKL